MRKREYLDQLESLLADISPEERQAAIEYFTDYLEDAGPDGEQEAMEHLGSPADVAAAVKEGLSDDSGAGRFTESGYESGTEASRYAVAKAGRPPKETENSGKRSRAEAAGNETGQNRTGQRETGRSQAGQSRTGQGETGRSQAGQSRADQRETGRSQAGQNRMGTGQSGTYWETEREYRKQRYDRPERKQRKSLGWLLILIGGIICVGIPLVSVLGSVFAAVVAAVAAVGIGGFAAALGLAVAGVVLIIMGIVKMAMMPGMGLMMMGGGFLCFAFAALALAAGVWMWRTVIPWAARTFRSIFQRIFRRERSRS